MRALDLPDITRRHALLLGAEGRAWLDGLDTMVHGLCEEWQLSLGPVLSGGSEAFVAACTLRDGREAVLKALIPDAGKAAGELATLSAANGRGYAELFASDSKRRAMLLERLGARLGSLGWSVDAQMDALLETLRAAWIVPEASGDAVVPELRAFMNGAEKARSLAVFIDTTWREGGKAWPERLIKTAHAFAEERERAFAPARAVLAHGDGHSWNTLLVPGSEPPRFKFVDPDGLFIERAYDLGILMRDWTDELLAGDPLVLGRQRCARLARETGEAQDAIWQWGFIERVSTGLHLGQLGEAAGAAAFRAVVEAWSAGLR